MTIEVRALEAGDFEAWLPLWNGYLDFYSENLPAGLTELSWQRIIDPNFNLHGLVKIRGCSISMRLRTGSLILIRVGALS